MHFDIKYGRCLWKSILVTLLCEPIVEIIIKRIGPMVRKYTTKSKNIEKAFEAL